jgi:hypothetical protein
MTLTCAYYGCSNRRFMNAFLHACAEENISAFELQSIWSIDCIFANW